MEQSEESRRRWEDLELDCLLLILQKVGLVSLLCDVLFVCKSWHEASLNSSSWQRIDFHDYCEDKLSNVDRIRSTYKVDQKKYDVSKLVKLIIERGRGNCTSLALSSAIVDFPCMHLTTNKSPKLAPLISMRYFWDDYFILCMMARSWGQLGEISLTQPTNLHGMIYQLGNNCKNLHSLSVIAALIHNNEALAIAKHLPKLKKLNLQNCFIEQKYLEIIVSSCRSLIYLNVECKFVGIWEEEKLRDLAANIKELKIDASHLDVRNRRLIYEYSDCRVRSTLMSSPSRFAGIWSAYRISSSDVFQAFAI